MNLPKLLADAPLELQDGIREFFVPSEWDIWSSLSYLESDYNAFALNDTTDADHPCGTQIGVVGGVPIYAERSVGYLQIDSCFYPTWEWQRLYNARHNCGTAHMIYVEQGFAAWYFSAKKLGLI